MSCYICLEEGVHTLDIGTCRQCNLHACGRPPQRRDMQFHGDACALGNCGIFYCERHLHTHPHASHGVSAAFPGIAFAAGVRVVAAGAVLDSVADPLAALRLNEAFHQEINRYLNVVAPGTDALHDLREMIPDDLYEVLDYQQSRFVRLLPEFFTRDRLSAVSRMALRTVWISSAALQPREMPGDVRSLLSNWVSALGKVDAVARVALDEHETTWFAETARQLPAGLSVTADIDLIPAESDPMELARFFLSQRGEGQQSVPMNAN